MVFRGSPGERATRPGQQEACAIGPAIARQALGAFGLNAE
jgi:hypothetical protein